MAKGFGVSVWCLDSLQPGRYVSSTRALAQSIYRRLTTPRGTLQGGAEESVYGYDLAGFVGSTDPDEAVVIAPSLISAELRKDDRIARVSVKASATTDATGATTLLLAISVVPANEARSFTLTLAASALTVAIIGGLPE